MCWAFVLCGLHRVLRLPLGSLVTFARIHCHVGVIFYCSITTECPIFEGLHWSFPWTGNILTLYRRCKGLHARPPITFFHPSAFCRALRRRCSCDTSCNSLFCQLIPFRLPTKAHITLKSTSNEHLAGENRRTHQVHLNYTTVSLWWRWCRDRHSATLPHGPWETSNELFFCSAASVVAVRCCWDGLHDEEKKKIPCRNMR